MTPTATAVAAQNGRAPLISFWRAAARHRDVHTTTSFTSGSRINIPLRRSGYLCSLRINLNGTVTVGAVGVPTDVDAATNWFPFIGLRSPQGSYVISTSSRALIDFNYRLHPVTSPIADPTYAPLNIAAAGTQNINVTFELPISINEGESFTTGLLMRQLSNQEFTLELQPALATDLAGPGGWGAGTVTAFNLTVTLEESWFEAVNPAQVQVPSFNSIVRLRDQQYGPVVQGDNVVNYAVQPTIMDAQHRYQENGVASHTNMATVSTIANFQNQLEKRRIVDIRSDNYRTLGKPMRNGVVLQNWTDDGPGVNDTRARDYLNTMAAAQVNFTHTTNASFNVTNSAIITTWRELVALGVFQ